MKSYCANNSRERIDRVQKALIKLQNGEMIVLLDERNRENEGDIIASCQSITKEQVNFMASQAKGLICAAISTPIARKLNLPLMWQNNDSPHETAFTVSIDVKKDLTTGISAQERANTLKHLSNEQAVAEDFVRPGHIFPVIAKEQKLLTRRGHTEGAVELMHMAGLSEAAVMCEIMLEDGSMAREKDLKRYCQKHQLHSITMEDLLAAWQQQMVNQAIDTAVEINFPSQFGSFQMKSFELPLKDSPHLILYKGSFDDASVPLVRVHSECLTGETFGSKRCDCKEQLERSMQMIENSGNGVILYMRQEGRGIGLMDKLKAYKLQDSGKDTHDANLELGHPADARDYTIAAMILHRLGIKHINLITNNPEKIESLTSEGIHVMERMPIECEPCVENHAYLTSKKERFGHYLMQ